MSTAVLTNGQTPATAAPRLPNHRRCGPCTRRTSRALAAARRVALVTTYQAGKLVMVRDEGDHLNTHFRVFQAPMGMALQGDRLAIGTSFQVWDYVNVPAVTAKLEPPAGMTAASCRARAMSPATSRSMRSPGAPAATRKDTHCVISRLF